MKDRKKQFEEFITTHKEYVVSAAIWVHDQQKHTHQPHNITQGFVVCGLGHHHCYQTLSYSRSDIYVKKYEKTQGFITSKNRFLTRQEAYVLAVTRGQIEAGNTHLKKKLSSEDLYPQC